MAEHKIQLEWIKGDVAFTYDTYSRNHQITFKDGVAKTFSAAAVYRGDATKGDPEDLFVAALSSCHMLFFLSFAAAGGFVIDRYEDEAIGEMGKNARGAIAMLKVHLRPAITWIGAPPSAEQLDALHHRAHEACYISNSVTTEVVIEPR